MRVRGPAMSSRIREWVRFYEAAFLRRKAAETPRTTPTSRLREWVRSAKRPCRAAEPPERAQACDAPRQTREERHRRQGNRIMGAICFRTFHEHIKFPSTCQGNAYRANHTHPMSSGRPFESGQGGKRPWPDEPMRSPVPQRPGRRRSNAAKHDRPGLRHFVNQTMAHFRRPATGLNGHILASISAIALRKMAF